MAIIISQGSGATVATAAIGGEHFGYNKIVDGNVSAGTIAWGINADGSGKITLIDSKTFIGLVTVGGISTLTLSDPKGYIGLVTIGGIGQITLSDPKGYIGLVTTTPGSAWPDPKTFVGFVTIGGGAAWVDPKAYIGLVSVANPLPVTFGSATVGNLVSAATIFAVVNTGAASDPKTFIGLTTNVNGSAWPDPKTYIGLVTVGGIGTLTLADPKGYIGLVTVGGIGTLTLADPKGFIGLVSLGGGTAWADPKAFIGLATVKASVKDTYASLATFTISIASLASSTAGVGRQSTLVDNTANLYTAANVYLKVYSGGDSALPGGIVNIYLLRYDNNSVADDGAGTTDAALTIRNAPLLGNIAVSISNVSTAYYGAFNTAPLGSLGPKWGIAIVNQAGAALGGTEGNHLKNWIGLNPQLT